MSARRPRVDPRDLIAQLGWRKNQAHHDAVTLAERYPIEAAGARVLEKLLGREIRERKAAMRKARR